MPKGEKVVDFERPPVMEVVFGAVFAPLRGLQSPHFGRLWAEWLDEFPSCQDVPPLLPAMEDIDGRMQVTMTLSNLPELRRVWLLSDDGRTIVQLQRDRLHVNRRRLDNAEEYEGFEVAMPRFERIWSRFCDFTERQFKEAPAVAQLELTYVNVIPACAFFDRLGQCSMVFPDFAWRDGGHEYLKEPDSFEWNTSFRLAENLGRLHVAVRSRSPRAGEQAVFNMELTARGRAKSVTAEGRDAWFVVAREAIDRGFVELTHPQMQNEIWRRSR